MTTWGPLGGYWGLGICLSMPCSQWSFLLAAKGTTRHTELKELIERKADQESDFDYHLVAYREGIELFSTVTFRYVDGFWRKEFGQAFAEILAERDLPSSWDGGWFGHVDVDRAAGLADRIEARVTS